jgi:phosphoribosylglycinamide formyltransferase-1
MAGRIVVLISGSGTNMEALADACERGDVLAEISAVIADRDCLGLQAAEKRDIPTVLVNFDDYDSRDEWNGALRDAIEKHEPNLVVSAGFMRLLAPAFVDAFEGRLINLHPSLLPSFPGANAVREALDYGVLVTGSTIHFVDYEVDHGPIIVQEAVRIEPGDSEETLHERIKAVEHRLLPYVCRLFLEGNVELEDGKVRVLG